MSDTSPKPLTDTEQAADRMGVTDPIARALFIALYDEDLGGAGYLGQDWCKRLTDKMVAAIPTITTLRASLDTVQADARLRLAEASASLGEAEKRADLAEKRDAFAWLIEAPGQRYLAAQHMGGYWFFWTQDHLRALRFYNKEQCDLAMSAIRELEPKLFGFTVNLGEAWPVEHAWVQNADHK